MLQAAILLGGVLLASFGLLVFLRPRLDARARATRVSAERARWERIARGLGLSPRGADVFVASDAAALPEATELHLRARPGWVQAEVHLPVAAPLTLRAREEGDDAPRLGLAPMLDGVLIFEGDARTWLAVLDDDVRAALLKLAIYRDVAIDEGALRVSTTKLDVSDDARRQVLLDAAVLAGQLDARAGADDDVLLARAREGTVEERARIFELLAETLGERLGEAASDPEGAVALAIATRDHEALASLADGLPAAALVPTVRALARRVEPDDETQELLAELDRCVDREVALGLAASGDHDVSDAVAVARAALEHEDVVAAAQAALARLLKE